MRCPQCKAVVPDGATFCDRCDAILDQTFLKGAGRDEKTPIPVPGPRPVQNRQPPVSSRQQPATRNQPLVTGPQRRTPAVVDTPVPGRPAAPPPRRSSTIPVEARRDGTEVPSQKTSVPPVGAGAAPQPQKRESLAPQAEDALADLVAYFRTLALGQRVALGGAAGALVFAFFPWAVLPGEGSVSGLDLGSIVVVIFACAFGTLVVLDHLGTAFVRNLRYYYTLVQLGIAAVIVLFCVYRAIHPADITEDVRMLKSSGADVKSSIQLGLPLTMLAAVAAAVGLFLPKRRQ